VRMALPAAEPLAQHPVLVQAPLGARTSAGVLDLRPGEERAARRLVAFGLSPRHRPLSPGRPTGPNSTNSRCASEGRRGQPRRSGPPPRRARMARTHRARRASREPSRTGAARRSTASRPTPRRQRRRARRSLQPPVRAAVRGRHRRRLRHLPLARQCVAAVRRRCRTRTGDRPAAGVRHRRAGRHVVGSLSGRRLARLRRESAGVDGTLLARVAGYLLGQPDHLVRTRLIQLP
jgi:hypothetical protein